jgi:hypothetical protein
MGIVDQQRRHGSVAVDRFLDEVDGLTPQPARRGVHRFQRGEPHPRRIAPQGEPRQRGIVERHPAHPHLDGFPVARRLRLPRHENVTVGEVLGLHAIPAAAAAILQFDDPHADGSRPEHDP